ncbi:hypothetical protein TSO221_25790 [Azospirillum sp. TSO22-1]|nr:hypothetical protein TSO221_25790 [Azospirillum sp. TSO22-1]
MTVWASTSIDESALKVFIDGTEGASWALAANERIQPFAVVGEALGHLGERDPGSRPRAVMLGGGCGEGKTTAMRQIVTRWLRQAPLGTRMALVREGSIGRPEKVMAKLTLLQQAAGAEVTRWLLAIDNAKPIEEIFALAEMLSDRERHNVDILFVCPHIAWPHSQFWPPRAPRHARFELICHDFIGPTLRDIGAIVDGWVAAGRIRADAWSAEADRLQRNVTEGASRFAVFRPERKEVIGSLLGALLVGTPGSGPAQRVARIVKELADEHAQPDGSAPMVYALGLVAAAHRGSFPRLTRGFLLRCLRMAGQCRDAGRTEVMVDRLLYEAVVLETADGTLATRHRAIAERLTVECAQALGRTDAESLFADLARFARDPASAPPYERYDGAWRQLFVAEAKHHLRRNTPADAALCCLACLSEASTVEGGDDGPLDLEVALEALYQLYEAVRRSRRTKGWFDDRLLSWIGALDRDGAAPAERVAPSDFDRMMADIVDAVVGDPRPPAAGGQPWRTVASRPREHRFATLYALIFRRMEPPKRSPWR